jgi:DNA-binding transcriptional ArsR family regulator
MNDEQLDYVFAALADKTRRRIIGHLQAQGEQSLFQICTHLIITTQKEGGKSISRQAVSQHLDLLERAGIVKITWSGRTKLHSFESSPLTKAVNNWLHAYLDKEYGK